MTAGSDTIKVGGVSIEYRRLRGSRPGPDIVLLHEGLGCVALWRDFPEKLAEATGLGVLAYSRAGYGSSDSIQLPRPLDYMSLEATRMLPRFLDTFDVCEFILLGHSDGASIALVYAGAVKNPRLRGVIAMAPHVYAEQIGIDSIAETKRHFESGELRRRLKKYHGENVDCAFKGWCDSWLDPRFVHWSIEADLAGIQSPLLLLQGRDDEYGTIEQLRRIERSVTSPVESCVLDRCGHAPHLEQPEHTLREVLAFLDRIEA